MKFLTTRHLIPVVFLLGISLLVFSCKKEASNSPTMSEEEATGLSDESARADASFEDLGDISMMAAEEEGIASEYGRASEDQGRPNLPFIDLRLRIGPCAIITVSPDDSTYPKTITIDFGNGCICADGKFRKGAIIIHLTAPIRRPGAVMTVTLRNYFLNHAHIEGTKVVTNHSSNGTHKFSVQVTGGRVTFPTGRGFMYTSLKHLVQIDGAATPRIVRDDIWKMEGWSRTLFNNGTTINLSTEAPLIKKVVCAWINKGTLKIKINDRVLFLHYDAPNNGDCDNKALLVWNNGGNRTIITLP